MNTELIAAVLDNVEPHLAIAILDKLVASKQVTSDAVSKLQLKYLGKTHLYEQFKTALKAQTSAKKEQIDTLTARITQLQQNSSKELADLEATQSVILIKKAISQDYETFKANRFAKSVLEKNENLNSVIQSRAYLNSCIHYARLVYNSGKYEESYKMINILYSLVDEPADIMNLIWARLANGLVLSVKGDEEVGRNVAEEFKSIKARFDVKNVQSQTQRVAMSASLVYYALIAFFFAAQKDLKFDFIFELFLDEKYLGAIQLGSPHLLRYLVLLYMISYEKKSLKVDHRTLVSIIKNDVFEYSDVFTDFVRKLYISFSLSDIRDQIEKIKQEVEKDLIFSAHANIIVENCKKMYFEVYCKIYNSVDIQTVAEFLGISMEDAEVWLVNLIRKNNIKASVDPSGKSLEIGVIGADEVDTLNKRTKELMGRNRIILSNVTKVLDHHHHQHQSK